MDNQNSSKKGKKNIITVIAVYKEAGKTFQELMEEITEKYYINN